jgi:hypothetical protein
MLKGDSIQCTRCVTHDLRFYERRLCHPDYSLVCLAVKRSETAAFVRCLFRYPEFNTKAKRLEKVIRVSQTGLQVWQPDAEKELFQFWDR